MTDHLTLNPSFPQTIDVIIEIPRGSHNKYEYDEDLKLIKLDRVLHSSVVYPTDYGFIPNTRSEDGDHVDVLLFVTDPVFPGCYVSARPIGIADMEDEAGKDWKVVAVADKDPRYADVQSLDDIDSHTLKEIQNFFEVYKQLENKWVKFTGWLPKEKAYQVLKETVDRFHTQG